MPDSSTALAMPTAMFFATSAKQYVKGRVLDVGCGDKPYKRLFPECEWVGLDNRPVAEIVADAHEIPEPDDSFDTVVCTQLLQDCFQPLVVIKECGRVLKPGGFLLVTAPAVCREDGEMLWAIKVRGLDYLVNRVGLQPISLGADGRVFSPEWSDRSQFVKFGIAVPPDLEGWLKDMDARYPAVSLCIAQKPVKE